jgi:hypothetical protein
LEKIVIDAKIFLNTKIEDSGLLSAMGNIGLAPVRYLFKGRTIQEVTEQKLVTTWPFKADNCCVEMLKTVASVVLLIPGLLLSLFKVAAYLYSDVKDKHALVKKHMTQINQSPSHESVGGAINRIVGDSSDPKSKAQPESAPKTEPKEKSNQTDLATVSLKDGSRVAYNLVVIITMNLEAIIKEDFTALFDLVEKCKDSNYEFIANPLGDSKATLKKWGMIGRDDQVSEDLRKIVLNSVEGSGLSLRLVNPLGSTPNIPYADTPSIHDQTKSPPGPEPLPTSKPMTTPAQQPDQTSNSNRPQDASLEDISKMNGEAMEKLCNNLQVNDRNDYIKCMLIYAIKAQKFDKGNVDGAFHDMIPHFQGSNGKPKSFVYEDITAGRKNEGNTLLHEILKCTFLSPKAKRSAFYFILRDGHEYLRNYFGNKGLGKPTATGDRPIEFVAAPWGDSLKKVFEALPKPDQIAFFESDDDSVVHDRLKIITGIEKPQA